MSEGGVNVVVLDPPAVEAIPVPRSRDATANKNSITIGRGISSATCNTSFLLRRRGLFQSALLMDVVTFILQNTGSKSFVIGYFCE